MDDEFEDKVLYQLLSKFVVGLPASFTVGPNTPIGYFWRMMRLYALRPEVLLGGTVMFVILFYLQAVDVWSRTLLGKIQYTLGKTSSKVPKLQFFSSEKINWEFKESYVAVYAIQGHRPYMEDRFVVSDDINKTGVSLFAVFDGHGGEFAADYARDKLMPNINKRVIELKNMISGKVQSESTEAPGDQKVPCSPLEKRKCLRKTVSTTDDAVRSKSSAITDPELLNKLNSLVRPITREVRYDLPVESPKHVDISMYIEGERINYAKLLTDEILAVDSLLVQAAKKNMDVAGTTALIAVMEDNKLIVANVGDSRGVMCDSKGNAIPLSFDHKPRQQRELERIEKAGGSVKFNGVWRVAGILATSRALGDYPLKDKKLVIADPDILTFDLTDHDPSFLILASDGLWDTFSNEEAVAFVRQRLNQSDFGARNLVMQSYCQGSLDNITVVIINLRHRKKIISSMSKRE